MSHTFNFTIKPNAVITDKARGITSHMSPDFKRAEWTGELRGTGLYFTDGAGDTWRVSAKDVTGLRRAV